MLGKFSTIISSKIFSVPFFFFFFLWEPITKMLVHLMLSQRSEAVLNSFQSFPFILLFSSYFHHSILQSLIHFSASVILLLVPSRVFLISVIVLFISVCLFFLYSMTLVIVLTMLNASYIFSILSQVFRASLLSLFWILFQGDYLFPLCLFCVVSFYLAL